MYVGRRYTSKVSVREILDFVCASCGQTSEAQVTGVGEGTGVSPYFLNNRGAQERAQAAAEKAARKNVRETLELARCPACGNHDGEAWKRQQRYTLIKMIAFTVALLGAAFLAYSVSSRSRHPSLVLPIVCAAAGVIGSLFIFFKDKKKRSTVDERVVFVPRGTRRQAAESPFRRN